MLPEQAICDRAVDEGSQKVLLEVFDMPHAREEAFVSPLPDERVRDHDCRRKRRWPPVGREIDDRGRHAVRQENVAGEIAMDQLATRIDRLKCRG